MTDFKCKILIPFLMIFFLLCCNYYYGGSSHIGHKVIKDLVIHDVVKFCCLEKNKRENALIY